MQKLLFNGLVAGLGESNAKYGNKNPVLRKGKAYTYTRVFSCLSRKVHTHSMNANTHNFRSIYPPSPLQRSLILGKPTCNAFTDSVKAKQKKFSLIYDVPLANDFVPVTLCIGLQVVIKEDRQVYRQLGCNSIQTSWRCVIMMTV